MTIGTRDQFRRAIGRAQALGGHRNVIDLGGGKYRVVGRQRTPYTVSVDADGEYACTCPAGQVGTPCWHQASVWLVTVQRAAFRPLATTATAAFAAVAPRVETPYARPSGRGIGISPADLGDDEPTLADALAAAGYRTAAA